MFDGDYPKCDWDHAVVDVTLHYAYMTLHYTHYVTRRCITSHYMT